MRIGIIGAGSLGGTLAHRLAALGHQVKVTNSRGPEVLTEAAIGGADPVTLAEVTIDVQMLVLSVPSTAIPGLRGALQEMASEVVVVDTTNYYPETRDGPIAAIEAGALESEWVADQLGRPVIKAFNNIVADQLRNGGRPPGATDRIALSVAGDDPASRASVLGLVEELGFDGIDVGVLAESWRQQPGTPGYCRGFDRVRLEQALAEVRHEDIGEYRRLGNEQAKYYAGLTAAALLDSK